jgi:hypothetical protein
MSWIITGTQKLDPDAAVYIDRVEAADGQSLEGGVKLAYSTFVSGCKADGIWDAIKASCILAGARTLSGALVPLVGTAPTNFNFVAWDYNRETGLKGDGSTKYLDSQFNFSSLGLQNNHHLSVFASNLSDETPANFGPLAASRNSESGTGSIQIINTGSGSGTPNQIQFFSSYSSNSSGISRSVNGIIALARSSSATFDTRVGGSSANTADTSTTVSTENCAVFARAIGGSGEVYSSSRLAFYSIGESLDLALLDARVTTLISDLAAAIP